MRKVEREQKSTHLEKNQDAKNKINQAIRGCKGFVFCFFLNAYTPIKGTWLINNKYDNGTFMGLNSA